MNFGAWLPVYGGWLRVKDNYKSPTLEWFHEITKAAERYHYRYVYVSENMLNCVYGPDHDVADAWVSLAALSSSASGLNFVGATKPGFISPLVLAQMVKTLQNNNKSKIGLSIVCGWWRREFEQCGVPWLDHDSRYKRAEEFIDCIRLLWSNNQVTYDGQYYVLDRAQLSGFTENLVTPEIWVSGHSEMAVELTIKKGDVIFINSMPYERLRKFVSNIKYKAGCLGRKVKVAVSCFVIIEYSDSKALEKYHSIIENKSEDLINKFKSIMAESDADVWKGLTDEQMVDSNCGFDASLIGSADSIIKRLKDLESCGVDIIMCQFDDMVSGVKLFGEKVLPQI